MLRIEFVDGLPEYDEHRSRGWYVVNSETGESDGPHHSRLDAEFAAGRPEDEDR